jgi:hypothetical protein
MTTTMNLAGAEAALKQTNKTALYAGILDTCASMKRKVEDLMTGKLKRAVSTFSDPNSPNKQLRIIQTVEDGRLKTSYWMDDSNIWAYCERRRKEFDEHRRHAALTGTEFMFREYYLSSWLLETYVLFKYHIDMRDSNCLDPSTSEYKKISWIMDRDAFASRYKLTTYSESRGMTDPFNTIKVDMKGLDLSNIINNTDTTSEVK